MPTTHSGFLIQSSFGTPGNFELVVPYPAGGFAHFWRSNEGVPGPWNGPTRFGDGPVLDVSLIQSNFTAGSGLGNLEVAVRVSDRLAHYGREDQPPYGWFGPTYLASGIYGNPALIQSRFGGRGNFELVAPLTGGGIAHYWRDNDAPGYPWHGPSVFAQELGRVDAVALVQSNFDQIDSHTGNLELVARSGHQLVAYWRDSGPHFAWRPGGAFFSGAAGVPGFIQSRFGHPGDFHLVTPLAAGGLAHLRRTNGASGPRWEAPWSFGDGHMLGVALIQNAAGSVGLGNLELVTRWDAGQAHYWLSDENRGAPPFNWNGPTLFGSSGGVSVSIQFG